ncbi:MAG TPA: putative O-glycosylation ligase, exosortase A system-associated [Acetobacteraceae bacterium]|nr:putative O-glycosylation ligase, exosortase A system-associated [Acetobacteraceae bacterium]
MRSLALLLGMVGLLPMAMMRPIVGVIIFDWISFMNPQQEAWGMAASVPWALLAAIATIIGCVFVGEPRRLPVNSTTILLMLFIVLVTISTMLALGPPEVVNPWYIMMVKSFLYMLIVAALLIDQKRVHALVWTMVISLGYYGVKGGAFTVLTHGNNHVYGAANSMISDNNQLAVALLISLPLMNFLRLQSSHKIIKIGLIIAMMLTLFAIVGTYSRGALLGLGAVSAFLWWNSKGRIRSGIMIAVGLVLAVSIMPADWTARMHTISSYQKDESAESRLTVWKEAFGMAAARPLTGAGFRSTATPTVLHRYYPDATPRAVHSIWFEVLSENGFPAFFVWVAMQIVGLVNVRRIRKLARGDPSLAWADDLARMCQVSIIAFLVGGSFLSLAYYDFYFTILIILASTRMMLERAKVPAIQTTRQRSAESIAMAQAVSWRMRRDVP